MWETAALTSLESSKYSREVPDEDNLEHQQLDSSLDLISLYMSLRCYNSNG